MQSSKENLYKSNKTDQKYSVTVDSKVRKCSRAQGYCPFFLIKIFMFGALRDCQVQYLKRGVCMYVQPKPN